MPSVLAPFSRQVLFSAARVPPSHPTYITQTQQACGNGSRRLTCKPSRDTRQRRTASQRASSLYRRRNALARFGTLGTELSLFETVTELHSKMRPAMISFI